MESIPYDKRTGKIWFNGKPLTGQTQIYIYSIMDYIMRVAFLKEREFMMEKYLNFRNILRDSFIPLREWE